MALPRFAVVDVETSGLSSTRHRILQIGLVTVEPDGHIADQWTLPLGAPAELDAEARTLHVDW